MPGKPYSKSEKRAIKASKRDVSPGFFGALKDATKAAISFARPKPLIERPAVIEAGEEGKDAYKRQHRATGNTPS